MGKLLLLSLFLVLLVVLTADGRRGDGEKRREIQVRGKNEKKKAASSGRRTKGRRRQNKKRKAKKMSKKFKRRGKKQSKDSKRKGKKLSKNSKRGGSKKSRSSKPGRKSVSGGSKNKKRKSKKKSRARQSKNCRQTTFCPADKALSLKILYGQVANFFRQLKRAENHASIVKKKKSKKLDFANDAVILKDAVGGNFSAPKCASSSRSASAAAGTGKTLANCSNSIGSSCADITVNTTLQGTCKTKMVTFQSKVTTCKTNDSCTCWAEAVAMKNEINLCKATDEMNRVKGLKGSCLAKFAECKKAQDSAVQYTANCPTLTSTMTTKAAKRGGRNFLKSLLARNILKHTA